MTRNTPDQPLLIAGTGALACLFAARFARAGIPVILLGSWLEGISALRENGLSMVDLAGQEHRYPVRVVDSPEQCSRTMHALVLVKSWQTARTAHQLAGCLDAEGIVLTLQNGLGNQEILERGLEEHRVFTGSTTTGATLLGPGRVRAGGEGVISLPEEPKLFAFEGWFRQAGFALETVTDFERIVWVKLIVNAAINPLTALLAVPNGELLDHPTARSVMANTAHEVAAVATAKGVRLPAEDPYILAANVARKTALNHSSMLQDIQRGAPTEIEAICGVVARMGNELGVPTPVIHTLYDLVKALAEVKSHQ